MEEEFFEEPSNISENKPKSNKIKGVFDKVSQNKFVGYLQAGAIIACAFGAFYLMFSPSSNAQSSQVQNQEQAQKQAKKEPTKTIDEVKEKIQNDLEQKYSEPSEIKETKNNTENLALNSSQNVKEDNAIENTQMDNEKLESIWKKKILLLFKNPDDFYFLLDQEIPAIVATNFKQERNNQNRIGAHNAKISHILLEKPANKKDFLDIKLLIESIDGEKYTITKVFPFSKFINLDFFEDCVIKTAKNGDENIFVEGDFIVPYIRIANISKNNMGKPIIKFEIYQENFGGNNFIYEYEVE